MRKASVIACAVLAVAGVLVATAPADAAGTPGTTSGPCGYMATPDDPPARPVSLPPDPTPTPDKGIVKVVVATNQGPMVLSLDRAKAPCTVQSFLHLAKSRFYDFTTCHRLTLYPTLKVLQCGDPSGTGEGGPGYQYKDELPTNLPPAPTDPTGVRRLYARGVLAWPTPDQTPTGARSSWCTGTPRSAPTTRSSAPSTRPAWRRSTASRPAGSRRPRTTPPRSTALRRWRRRFCGYGSGARKVQATFLTVFGAACAARPRHPEGM